MPIEGRSARDCAEHFRSHLAELLAKTIAPKIPLLLYVQRGSTVFGVTFLRGDKPTTVPLETKYGRLFFHLAQLVEAEKTTKNRFRLRTLQYWYRLQATGSVKDEALLRWEYERVDPAMPGPPRHHLHAPARVAWGNRALDLNRVHTPSGWVTIEELVRFLIVELGAPAVAPDWPKVLAESEDVFFQQFSGKRRSANP